MSPGTPKRAGELLGALAVPFQRLGQNRHRHLSVTPSISNQSIDRSIGPPPDPAERCLPTWSPPSVRPFFPFPLPFPGPAGREWSGVEWSGVAWRGERAAASGVEASRAGGEGRGGGLHNPGSAPHWPRASSARPRPGSAQMPVPAPDWPAGPLRSRPWHSLPRPHVDRGAGARSPHDTEADRPTDRRTHPHTSEPQAQKPRGNAGVTLA